MAKIFCNVPSVNQSANCGSLCACTHLRGVCGAPISHLHRNHGKKHMGHILHSQLQDPPAQTCIGFASNLIAFTSYPHSRGTGIGTRDGGMPQLVSTQIFVPQFVLCSPPPKKETTITKKTQARSEERAEHFCKEISPGHPSVIYTIIHNHAVTRHKQMQQCGVMTQLELDGRPCVEIFITPCS